MRLRDLKPDTWYQVTLIVTDKRVVTYVNGKKVAYTKRKHYDKKHAAKVLDR